MEAGGSQSRRHLTLPVDDTLASLIANGASGLLPAPASFTDDVTASSSSAAAAAAVLAASARVNAALVRAGVGDGDVVALALRNGPAFVAALFGATSIGNGVAAVAAPLNPAARGTEFAAYLQRRRAHAIVVHGPRSAPAPAAAVAAAQAAGLPIIVLGDDAGASYDFETLEAVLLGHHDDCPRTRHPPPSWGVTSPSQVALLLPTSGTTGTPKSVPLQHANLARSARSIARFYGHGHPTETTTVLGMPLFHIHGLAGCLLTTLAAEGAVWLPREHRLDAGALLVALAATRATWVTAVPAVYQALIAAADAAPGGQTALPALALARSSSAPLAAATLARLETALGAVVLEAYSMSEASHQMTSNPPPVAWATSRGCARTGERVPGTVGVAAGAEVAVFRFLTPNEVEAGCGGGRLRALPSGAEGEICVRGPGVFSGYLDGPPEQLVFVDTGQAPSSPSSTTTTNANRWFRTGDRGVISEEGYVWLTGRLKELVNVGGEKVSPAEVDAVLLAHPAIGAAAAFAWPDAEYGEVVGAAIVLRGSGEAALSESPPPTATALRAHCAASLSAAKVPASIWVLDAIPRTATGKIQRAEVAKAVSGRAKLTNGGSGTAGHHQTSSSGDHPDQSGGKTSSTSTAAAETSSVVSIVRRAWQAVLPPGAAPTDADEWLHVGGTSLLTQRLLRELVVATGVDALTVADLYDCPTIAMQAGMLTALRRQQQHGGAGANGNANRQATPSGGALARPIDGGSNGRSSSSASSPVAAHKKRSVPSVRQLVTLSGERALGGTGERQHTSYALLSLEGSVLADSVQRALNAIAARHSALRARFDFVDVASTATGDTAEHQQTLVALTSPPDKFSVPLVTESAEGSAALEAALARHRQQDTSFDVRRGPLLSALLVASGGERVLSVRVHHAVFDGWSRGVFVRELAAELYGRGTAPSASPLPPPSYDEFIDWLDGRRGAREDEASLDWFAEALTGAFPSPDLHWANDPVQSPRGARRHHQPLVRALLLSPTEARALRLHARSSGLPVDRLAHCAVHLLLHRVAGAAETLVSVMSHGRGFAPVRFHDTIGCFAQLVPVRLRVEADSTVATIAAAASKAFEAAAGHAEVGVGAIARRCDNVESASDLIRVVFNFSAFNAGAGAAVRDYAPQKAPELADAGPAHGAEMTVSVRDPGGDSAPLHVTCWFDSARVDATAASELTRAYLDILRALGRPGVLEQSPSSVLPDARLPEFARLATKAIAASNDTPDRPVGAACPALVWAKSIDGGSGASVSSLAVEQHGETSLTHGDLARRAHSLCAVLAARGISSGQIVSTLASRSPDIVVAMVALSASGVGYVPMDPQHPMPRLARILDDTAPVAVLSREACAAEWRTAWLAVTAAHQTCPVIDIAAAATFAASSNKAALCALLASASAVPGSALCSIVFTSGTTGVPKGVCQHCLESVNNMPGMCEGGSLGGGWLQTDSASRVFNPASVVFDMHATYTWTALGNGAAIVQWANGADPAADIARGHCTHAAMTPTLLEVCMASASWNEAAASLCVVMTCGEPVSALLARRFTTPSSPLLINTYGPCESPSIVTLRAFVLGDSDLCSGSARVHIGKPRPGHTVAVVDAARAPITTPALAGEIAISGIGQARYHNDAAQTEEKFFHPHWAPADSAQGRFYQTGDIGRWSGEGNLEIFGRRDDQVKCGGVRIELNEVVGALQRHAAVVRCVVAKREDPISRAECLIAWVSLDHGVPPGFEAEIYAWVRGNLPVTHCPSEIVVVQSFPLALGGKVDKRALPDPPAWGGKACEGRGNANSVAITISPSSAQQADSSLSSRSAVLAQISAGATLDVLSGFGGGGGQDDADRAHLRERAAYQGINSISLMHAFANASRRELAICHLYGLGILFMISAHVCNFSTQPGGLCYNNAPGMPGVDEARSDTRDYLRTIAGKVRSFFFRRRRLASAFFKPLPPCSVFPRLTLDATLPPSRSLPLAVTARPTAGAHADVLLSRRLARSRSGPGRATGTRLGAACLLAPRAHLLSDVGRAPGPGHPRCHGRGGDCGAALACAARASDEGCNDRAADRRLARGGLQSRAGGQAHDSHHRRVACAFGRRDSRARAAAAAPHQRRARVGPCGAGRRRAALAGPARQDLPLDDMG